MSDSFSERMRRRWQSRRGDGGQDPHGPGGAFGADQRGTGPQGGPGADPWGARDPRGWQQPDWSSPETAPPPPQESEQTARARMLYERVQEAYRAGDVAGVAQLAELMPDGPDGDPYRTYARVLAAESQADDARAVELARDIMDRLPAGHPEEAVARGLFGEVMAQALVMGSVPLAGNLEAAQRALAAPTQYYLHPSGMMLKFDEEQESHPLLLVLQGDTTRAVRAAQRAVREEKKGPPASRADALCTLSLALCAAGDIMSARNAIVDASKILPGRPRIAATHARIESSPAATLHTE
ncbi:hypothetical protein [Yinghuangia seranimata]|uniref:hypothetical protein n=1 Tax=Yinghuangia seranimata TaxID=408067 RepID=UPI00248BD04D|nr:hypothetical protein [Yinghuangia seranimata]MDI2128906.1 hypothetical protein [Yinghuangia seranimata]